MGNWSFDDAVLGARSHVDHISPSQRAQLDSSPQCRADKASAIARTRARATEMSSNDQNSGSGGDNDNMSGDSAPLYFLLWDLEHHREICMGLGRETGGAKKRDNRGRLTFGHQSE